MNIYDNIGCSFEYSSSKIILTGPLPGCLTLNDQHVGSTIPYLARNINGNQIDFEVGTADIIKEGAAIVAINRKVSASSNNNSIVDFSGTGSKQFYLFVNTANFNTGFNNVLVRDDNFDVLNIKTAYLVDFSLKSYILANLPDPAENKNLSVEFRTLGNGSLIIKYERDFDLTLSGYNRYTKLISTGDRWIELKDNTEPVSAQSTDIKALSSPDTNSLNYSLQYKVDTNFGGSELFWDPTTNALLFGDPDKADAKNVIPSSGHYPVIFNQTRKGSDFIVYGTGNAPGYPEKNLYFTSTGKLGINIPSGLKPATVLHIVNTLCKEGLRLENFASCFPADITLYQNSLETPSDAANDISFAQITFAAKNTNNVKRNFAQIVAKRKSVSSSKGELQILVGDSALPANSGIATITTNPDQTSINHGSNSLVVNTTGSSINAASTYVGVNNGRIDMNAGSITSPINITGVVTVNNRLKLNYINTPNAILAIDDNNNITTATGFQIPGVHDSFWPYEPRDNVNKIGAKDLTWERYRPKAIAVDALCLTAKVNEITLAEPAPIEEFVNGDQIAIYNSNNNSLQYRKIDQVLVSGDLVSGMIVDQSIVLSGTLSVYSTTRGGVINNTIYSSGAISDATAVTISTRPNVPTVFNTKQKNIDFTVYGTETVPAFSILANASIEDKASGIFYGFATQSTNFAGEDVIPFASRIGADGYGINNTSNNAVNFREAADTGLWPHRVTAVGTNGKPSYYGTYDQNGNAFEWIEDQITNGSLSNYQYICGGSWRTLFPEGLRGYIFTPRSSGFDDVGFRVSSQAGFSNPTLEQQLGLKFVRIDNPGNLPDSNPLYIEDYNNRFDINSEPSPVIIPSLGVVNYVYNISAFEVTNSQYATFLNSVATGTHPNGLYNSKMSSDSAGGIDRTGNGASTPFSYSVKSGMNNMPVVFVDYISAIRFINWLSNGGQTGANAVQSLEYGAYSIEGEAVSITKNKNRGYYLPSLHEWHKAAYYIPLAETLNNPKSAITIRTNTPYTYASGQISSLTVSGHMYADSVKIGHSGKQLIQASNSGQYFNVELGPIDAVSDTNTETNITSQYNTFISNTGICFATTGNTVFINKINPLSITSLTPSGMVVSNQITIATINSDGSLGSGIVLTPSGTQVLDSSGNIKPGGAVPGINGGLVYKGINDNNLYASDKIFVEEFATSAGTGYYPKIAGTTNNAVIFNNINGYLSSSGFFTVGVAPEGAEISDEDNKIVSVFNPPGQTGVAPATFCASRVLIGPVLDSFSGSLLQHNGKKPATWTANDFFKADGVKWIRNIKRAVKILSYNEIQFINLDPSEGGTGDIDLETIESEFAYTDTIAIYNKNREVFYVKIAKTVLVDNAESYGGEDSLWDTETNKNNKILRFIPPLPEEWIESEPEITSIGPIILGYAFSIQKGAYLNMLIEPSAVRAFDTEGTYDDENNLPYPVTRFKPSTTNTLSIRPSISTSFNTLAENIDFAIYGHRKTFLNRYEPEWFNKDETGLPSGLVPAFKINAHMSNSVLGSLESGVYRTTIGNNVASGIFLDLNPKLTINMMKPYAITSLEGIKRGLIESNSNIEINRKLEKEYGLEIPVTGVIVSGNTDLTTYADLSIGGTTYSSGLIANQIALKPIYSGTLPLDPNVTERVYIPNYPLTINAYGQIISLIPPPVPQVPNIPTNLIGIAKNRSVVLTWAAPEDDGGARITAYVVEFSADDGATWVVFDQLDSQSNLPSHPNRNTTRTVNNLLNGVSYLFRVYAINTVGKGDYSLASQPIAPMNLIPTEPINIKVNGESIPQQRPNVNPVLSWNPPTYIPAGRSITSYQVSYFIDIPDASGNVVSYDKAQWQDITPTNSTSQTLQAIPTGEYVVFSVIAIMDTDLGSGTESVRAIYRSPGSGIDPRDPVIDTPPATTDYNFGKISFAGTC